MLQFECSEEFYLIDQPACVVLNLSCAEHAKLIIFQHNSINQVNILRAWTRADVCWTTTET